MGFTKTQYLYKYCTSDTFENYLLKGKLRLGTLAQYRSDYERGVGYADREEGISSSTYKEDLILNPQGNRNHNQLQKFLASQGLHLRNGRAVGNGSGAIGLNVRTNAYIFSTAKSYEEKSHRVWFEREGCNYDVCVKYRTEKLEEAFHNFGIISNTTVYQGDVDYTGSDFDMRNDMCDDYAKYLHTVTVFTKPPSFEWEHERRFAILNPSPFLEAEDKTHLDLEIDLFKNAIDTTISI